MTTDKQLQNTPDPTDAYIHTLMATLGITDEDLDNMEKELAERHRQAYIKWQEFIKDFMPACKHDPGLQSDTSEKM